MRVLHIYTGNLYGGIESMLSTLARCRNLCADMEPHYALCFHGRLSEDLSHQGVPLYDLGHVRARNLLSVKRARRRLADILRAQKIEVAICHAVWSQVIFGSVIRKAGIRQVFWQHDAVTGKGWLEKAAARIRPSLVISNSFYSQSTLIGLYTDVPSHVVYCPIELINRQALLVSREEIRKRMNTPMDATVIVQLSRLEPWKGHELHIRALARLQELPNWECWMVGGPQRPHEVSYFEKLKQLAKALSIEDRVRFLGQRDDPLQFLAAADIHCQPNAGPEAFGLTFVEALAMGLPIVSTKSGAVPEIVNDFCGVLVEPANIFQLADTLASLIQNSSARHQLGSAGPRRAAELCDATRQLNKLVHVLSDTSTLHSRPANLDTVEC